MKKPQSFEARYPTRSAREKADEVFDRLPLSTPLGVAIRVWELEYLTANGVVKGSDVR